MVRYDREGRPVFNGRPEEQFILTSPSARRPSWTPRPPRIPRLPPGTPPPPRPAPTPLWPLAPEVKTRARLRALGLVVVSPERADIRRLRA
jgi:hypothetical protein